MRRSLILLVALGLAACQPPAQTDAGNDPVVADPAVADPAAADALAEATGNDEPGFSSTWTLSSDDASVVLTNQHAPNAPAFVLTCARERRTLSASAGVDQVGLANMAPPFALVMSGATFDAALVPGLDGSPAFAVSAPLSPALLAAVRDTVTARIFVNDGYAFAESEVDPSDEFETFVEDCSNLTGVASPP